MALSQELEAYCEQMSSEEPPVLKELVAATQNELQYADMVSGRQVAHLLRFFVRLMNPKRILEVGTFTGYSALMMAEDLDESGQIITIEMNERYRAISEEFFGKPPFRNKIRQIMGNAVDIIPALEGTFGLIFLDADKARYPDYYPLLREKLSSNGLLIIDNVLWKGGVLEESDRKSRAVHQMNEMVRDDPDMEQVMLPVRDGITIARHRSR